MCRRWRLQSCCYRVAAARPPTSFVTTATDIWVRAISSGDRVRCATRTCFRASDPTTSRLCPTSFIWCGCRRRRLVPASDPATTCPTLPKSVPLTTIFPATQHSSCITRKRWLSTGEFRCGKTFAGSVRITQQGVISRRNALERYSINQSISKWFFKVA